MLFDHVLSVLVLGPIAAALLVWTFPAHAHGGARAVALVAMLAEAALAGSLAGHHAFGDGSAWVAYEQAPWWPAMGVSWALGLDGWSMLLTLATVALAPVALLLSYDEIEHRGRDFAACLLLLEGALIGNLLARDLWVFYLFWEAMLLPAYGLLGAWGGERAPRASRRFFLYTMAGSMLLLTALVAIGCLLPPDQAPSYLIADVQATLGQLDLGRREGALFLAFALAFLIKVPLWPLHGWQPEAYGEAPVSALVLVSGIMVKLGAIAWLRLGLLLFPRAATFCLPTVMALAVLSCLYAAWLAAGQSRLRRLFAYASMSHMGLCVLATTSMTPLGLTGAMVQMVAHAINAAAMLALIGMIERRYGSDYYSELGGLAHEVPELATCLVITALATMGLPGLNGFVGEFMLLAGTWQSQGLGVGLSRGALAQGGIVAVLTLGALIVLRLGYALWQLDEPIWRTKGGRALRALAAGGVTVGVASLVALPAGERPGGLLMRLLAPLATSEARLTAPSKVAVSFALLSVVLSAVYMLRAVERTCFGPAARSEPVADLSGRERLVIWPMVAAMVAFGLWPQPIVALAEPAAGAMVHYFREGAGWLPAEGTAPPAAVGVESLAPAPAPQASPVVPVGPSPEAAPSAPERRAP